MYANGKGVHMKFNLNEFLMAVSYALDYVEIDLLGVSSNHSKRVAYMSLKIAQQLGLSQEQQHDIVALSILHDNGASENTLHKSLNEQASENRAILEGLKLHCILGEENVKDYPFFTDTTDVIRYHHERYDGSGYFHKKAEDTPLMAQIIAFSDGIDLIFNLKHTDYKIEKKVIEYVKAHKDILFESEIGEAFLVVAKNKSFWLDVRDRYIDTVLKKSTAKYTMDVSLDQVHKITRVLSKIIDAKSKYTRTHSQALSEKVGVMADFYSFQYDHKMKLIIAADLHDLGKLGVSNDIIDSHNKLSEDEFEMIKEHPYYTGVVLGAISGFEEIAYWAANHHERLDGSGYPNGLGESQLDFESRLLGCLDVYQALTEDRPYRQALGHERAMEIITSMGVRGLLDQGIIKDIDQVFKTS
jgi:HD-GYP domain-containing protein (c-di-GMP phosphodiesterase class II)